MFGTREPRLNSIDPSLLPWITEVMDHVDPHHLRAQVEALPAPRNRLHWPEAMSQTDQIILDTFRESGWITEKRPFAYRKDRIRWAIGDAVWNIGDDTGDHGSPLHLAGLNILGVKEGVASGEALIVGAHHDTIRDTGGADDNGAGIAALLMLARILAPYRFQRSVILAAFDMEELGLLGSRALVPVLLKERPLLGAVIFETMAYTSTSPNSQRLPPGLGLLYPGQIRRLRRTHFSGDWTLLLYRQTALPLVQGFAEGLAHLAGPGAPLLVRTATDLPVIGRPLGSLIPSLHHFARSDHTAFWEADVPAMMVTDTANFRNPHYHRPSDTPDTLDYDRLAAIVGATAVAIARMAGLVT